jgi:hypothetical protein
MVLVAALRPLGLLFAVVVVFFIMVVLDSTNKNVPEMGEGYFFEWVTGREEIATSF